MKKHVLLPVILFLISLNFTYAQQAPKLMFKTTVKDKDGVIVKNSSVIIKISIIEGNATGKEIYSEMHSTRTDEQGQVVMEVGKGTMTSGSLKNINWETDNFIKTEAQPMGTYKVSRLRRTPSMPESQNKNLNLASSKIPAKPVVINTDSLRQLVEARKAAAAVRADSIKKVNEAKKIAELAKADSIKKADETKRVAALAKADSTKKAMEAKRLAEIAKADSIKKAAEAKKLLAIAKADSAKKAMNAKRLADIAKADSIKKAAEAKRLSAIAKADSAKKAAYTKTPPPIIKIDTVAKKTAKPKSTTAATKAPNTDSLKKINEAKRTAALAKADSLKKALELNRLIAQKKTDSIHKAALTGKTTPAKQIPAEDSDFKVVLKVDTAKAVQLKKQIEALKYDSTAHTTTITEKRQRKKSEATTNLQPTTVATQVSVKQTVGFETVIKNINGAPFADAPVMVKTSVLKDSAKGDVIFSEEHTAITDSYGIVKLNIGGGSVVSGDFKNIDWANGKHFIKTEANPTGVTKIDRINYSNTLLPQADTIDKKQTIALKKEMTGADTISTVVTKDSVQIKNTYFGEDKYAANTGIENAPELNEEKINSSSDNKLKWDEYRVKLYLYNESINKNPNNIDAYIQRGMIKNELEDFRGAISDFTTALSIDSGKADVYNSRGLAKINLSNYKGAIDDFSKSLSINKQQANAYALRGVANAYVKNFKEALSNLDTAISLAGDSSKYYAYRGTCKYNMNDLRGALDDYSSAIRLNPNDYLIYYNRGNTKTQMRDQIDAIDDYNKSVTLAPSFAKAYYKRGNAKADLKDIRGAIIDYEKTFNIDPENAKAYYNAGVMKTKLKEFEAAINYFDKAITIAPDWGSAYYNRGICKISIGQINEGCIDLSMAGEKGYPKAYDVIKRRCAK